MTFWDKLDKLPAVTEKVAPEVIAALERWLPEKGLPYKLVHRIAGLGSLGRQRFVALADWRGGLIAREAKALAVSACLWEKQREQARDSVPEDSRHGRCACSTPGCSSAARGSSAVWPPIAAASSWRPCPRTATNRSFCRRWARRRPTSRRATRGAGRHSRRFAEATRPVAGKGCPCDGRCNPRGLETVAEDAEAVSDLSQITVLAETECRAATDSHRIYIDTRLPVRGRDRRH